MRTLALSAALVAFSAAAAAQSHKQWKLPVSWNHYNDYQEVVDLMKRMQATGIRKAHEPIMMGYAVSGLMPRRLTMIMIGAYAPTPMVIIAPMATFAAIAKASCTPSSPNFFPSSSASIC